MRRSSTKSRMKVLAGLSGAVLFCAILMSSSHRKAPLISYNPQPDNTDLYVFRSPAILLEQNTPSFAKHFFRTTFK